MSAQNDPGMPPGPELRANVSFAHGVYEQGYAEGRCGVLHGLHDGVVHVDIK